MPKPYLYKYSGTVTRIIDGDTFEVVIDLGFDIKLRQVVRLAGINAPEMHGESQVAGQAAKDFLASLIGPNSPVLLQTEKPHDKYGRYLAWAYIENEIRSINMKMADNGHAVLMS